MKRKYVTYFILLYFVADTLFNYGFIINSSWLKKLQAACLHVDIMKQRLVRLKIIYDLKNNQAAFNFRILNRANLSMMITPLTLNGPG
jgi:hypothetical protein